MASRKITDLQLGRLKATVHNYESLGCSLIANALSIASHQKGGLRVGEPIAIKGSIVITPIPQDGGGWSGCVRVDLCYEDPELQQSVCEEGWLCGEFEE